MKEFTAEQLENYAAYEKVRQSGRFNMLDPRAMRASGLSEAEYVFVLDNFNALRVEAQHKDSK